MLEQHQCRQTYTHFRSILHILDTCQDICTTSTSQVCSDIFTLRCHPYPRRQGRKRGNGNHLCRSLLLLYDCPAHCKWRGNSYTVLWLHIAHRRRHKRQSHSWVWMASRDVRKPRNSFFLKNILKMKNVMWGEKRTRQPFFLYGKIHILPPERQLRRPHTTQHQKISLR